MARKSALYDVDVYMIDTKTGERAVYRDKTGWDDEDGFFSFNWAEGNYSCDCNRHLFFERALGRKSGQDCESECSEGRYRIERIVRLSDGVTVYEEAAP
jgi:hypothetical protein